MKTVRGQMRYAEAFVYTLLAMTITFVIVPYTQHNFPTTIWLPFDPYASNLNYNISYVVQSFCGASITIAAVSTNVYVFTVLLCLSFNYILLGKRFQCIGYTNRQQPKVDDYGDLIDSIKLHLKMNQ